MQTQFSFKQKKVSSETHNQFKKLISDFVVKLREDAINEGIIDSLFMSRKTLTSEMLKHKENPENYTRINILDKMLIFLGYSPSEIKTEANLQMVDKRSPVDYKLVIDATPIYGEAEPFNKDLEAERTGINQVKGWIEKKQAGSDYGFATNGVRWMLIRIDKGKFVTLEDFDLSPFFASLITQQQDVEQVQEELLNKFYYSFSRKHILERLHDISFELKRKQEQITGDFYKKYIKYVFGVEKGKKLNYSLVNQIKCPVQVSDVEKRLFSVITLNRMIFVKFLEDKSIIERGFLLNLVKEYKTQTSYTMSFYLQYLKPLFYEVFNTQPKRRKEFIKNNKHFKNIPYLNGGLFARTNIQGEDEFDITNDILFTILGDDFLEHYDFTISQKETETSLDPQILGNVFEKTINYITSDPSSNKRKEQGAYYTPSNITKYISNESIKSCLFDSIISYLREKGWKQSDLSDYETFDLLLANLPRNTITVKEIYEGIVKKINVLDPAVGSGHFLKDAMDLLLRIHLIFLDALKTPINIYELKKHIITSCIYGVDIDENAVEIAKLRVWLSLIEDLETKDIDDIKALPNIEYNIRSGNTLFGLLKPTNGGLNEFMKLDLKVIQVLKDDYPDEVEQMVKLSTQPNVENMVAIKEILIKIYKSEEDSSHRGMIKNVIELVMDELIERMDEMWIAEINKRLPKKKVITQKQELINEIRPFHWYIEFHDIMGSGGFSVVIGNPPYVRQELLKDIKPYLEKEYSTYSGVADLYTYFYERSIMLLRKNGYLSYISSNKWMKVQYGLGMRKLLKQKHIVKLIDFFELKVFEDASIEPIIVIMKNVNEPNKSMEVAQIDTLQYDDFNSYLKTRIQLTNQTELDDDGWNLMQDESKGVLQKIKKNSISLKDFTNDGLLYGIKTGLNEVFVIDEKIKDKLISKSTSSKQVIHPIIDGVKINTYTYDFTNQYVIFVPRGDDINKYPAVRDYLKQFYERIRPKNNNEKTGRKAGSYQWFESQDNVAYWKKFLNEKIVFIHTAKEHKFAFDDKGYFLLNNCYFISSSNRYLLAYLNSNLFKYYKMNTFVAFGDASTKGRCKLDYNKMVKVPIKPISKEQEKEFDSAVNEMIKLKAGKQTQKIEEMDKKLNDMIYKVYGITAEERKIIEGV
jgi:hypothetical protein